MATFDIDGLDKLINDMEKVAGIPDTTVSGMLEAQAKTVIQAQRRELAAQGLIDTRQLEGSLQNTGLSKNGLTRYVDVYPKGDRRNRHTTYRSRGLKRAVTNNEVGFIHEFGAPGRNIPGKSWMEKANESSEKEQEQAAMNVYDRWLKSNNL